MSNVLCNGGNDGSVAVSVSGGTAPIVYTWTTGSGNTPFAGNLSAGQYSVTITDAFQCVQTLTMTVTEPSILVSAISSFNSISCYAAQDGSASVSVSGGTSPYSYLWNPGYDSTMQISNLNSGNYTVAVTDAHGCTTQSQVTLTEPAQLQVQVSSTPATCGSSNGSATATTNGGTLPYTYQWSPGGMTSDHVTSIPAGSYSVIVTDAHNCQVNLNTFISNIGGPTLSLLNVNPVSCFGGSNGDATIAVLQGTSPYTYQWYPAGGTDSLASNLSAGTYSVLVADVNNCLTGMTVTISEPAALQASPQATDALCSGSADGSASVVISGGTQPYQYDWSTGATSSTATGLSAGSYSVRVTDSNGCTLTQNAVVSEPSPLNTNIHTSDVNCFGGSDGSAMVEITGGSPGYTYSWSNGATVNSVTGIRAGNYNVTITDQHGCTILGAVSLSEPAALALAFTTTDALCFGSSDGIAIANISGGTPPYNYQWSPSGGSQEIARDLPAGTYSLSVTDEHGCTQSSSLTIGAPPAIQVITNQQNARCYGSSDAFANVLQTGGTPPYNYQWTNGSDSVSTGPVSAGNYSVQITDQHGCTVSTSVQLTEPSPLVLNVSGGGWICIGQEMNLNANASGGTSMYSYQWSNSNTSASIVVTPTTTEVYTVSVTDAQGCTAAPQSIAVNVYPGLMAATAGDDSICVGRSDTLLLRTCGISGMAQRISTGTPCTYLQLRDTIQ
ncbi:MAG: SprB repeat-containing protein [Bacteroidetes bacterium]|nr:SprB repeat-containing protein [Bacteroidota bacterium]